MLSAILALAVSSPPVIATWGAPVTAPGAIRPSTDPGPYVVVPAKPDADGAEPAPTPTLTSLAQDITDIPPGAPTDDYGLVGWCQGALTGHMSLYSVVRPELKKLSRAGEAKADADMETAQMQAGREYLDLYDRARRAADARNAGVDKARGEVARDAGGRIWNEASRADPQTRMWSWIMWELPARCETAARRLEADQSREAAIISRHTSDDVAAHPHSSVLNAPTPNGPAPNAPVPNGHALNDGAQNPGATSISPSPR